MRKLRILIATLALTALMAAPVAAQTTTAEIGGVSATATNEFLGENSAEASVGDLTAEAEDDFLFFDDDFFDDDDDFEFVVFF
ncbi:MAG TPA: hypothetical protein VK869_08905 [Rubrobacteraceae bacterium]|nr:hypothetical protein [Rubrobacteraceae bacterium]